MTMLLWNQVVEILRESILAYAHIFHGSLGSGILVVTFLARLALLPMGVRVARAAARQQEVIARLQPRLDALKALHRNNPARLAEETRQLLAREGANPLSGLGCLGTLAQLPVFIALYSSVRQAASIGGRFVWIRDLAKPDWVVAIVATIITCLASVSGGTPSQNRSLVVTLSAVLTIAALSKMAAGVGLYWGMSSLFSAAQGWAVQRLQRRAA
jgi:YidC/Oxa1 family membrane protein insertase